MVAIPAPAELLRSALSFSGSFLYGLVAFAVLISVVVFVHELGHLLVARWLGVRAERFSIGFGKPLFGFRWGETEFVVAPFPFGGYVKFTGENVGEAVSPADQQRSFLAARPGVRAAIAFAGPAFNVVLVLVVLTLFEALPHPKLAPVVGWVKRGSPAARAGVQALDRFVAVDGKPVHTFDEAGELIHAAPGRSLAIRFQRGEQQLELQITPASIEDTQPLETVKQGRIGVGPVPLLPVVALLSPAGAAARAGLQTFDRIAKVDGVAVQSWDALVQQLARRLGGPAAATGVLLEGTRAEPQPRAAGVEPGEWLSFPRGGGPFQVQLQLPSWQGAPPAPDQVEELLGLTAADLNVAEVDPDGPAAKAGLRRGDRVVEVEGRPVYSWQDEVDQVRLRKGQGPLSLVVLRDGERLALQPAQVVRKVKSSGIPQQLPDLGLHVYALAGEAAYVDVHHGLVDSLRYGAADTAELARQMGLSVWLLLRGRIPSDTVGGPLMIATEAKKAAERGASDFIGLLALISMNLALMNLLPLPALDGFQILAAAIEGVRRKPLSAAFREATALVGLVLVGLLMIFALRNDLMRLFES